MRSAWLILLVFLAACAPVILQQNTTQPQPGCAPPSYEYVPSDCCLDKDANGVCDRDEQPAITGSVMSVPEPQEPARSIMSGIIITFRQGVANYAFKQGKDAYVVQGELVHVTFGSVKELPFSINDTARVFITDLFVDRRAREAVGYCDPRTEAKLMGGSYADRSVCKKLIDIPIMLPFDEHDPYLPEDWLQRFSHAAPTLVEDTDQYINEKTINPVLHFTENGNEVILRIDATTGLPVKVEIVGSRKDIVEYSMLVHNRVRPEELLYRPYAR